jgi:hypothetical protein
MQEYGSFDNLTIYRNSLYEKFFSCLNATPITTNSVRLPLYLSFIHPPPPPPPKKKNIKSVMLPLISAKIRDIEKKNPTHTT